MGTGIEIQCGRCGYSETFQLGVGMMYYSLEAVQDVMPAGTRETAMNLVRHHDVRETDYYHALYVCDECHGLYERFYVRVDYDGDKSYETVFRCPTCDVVLRDTEFTYEEEDEDLPKLPSWLCPKCGNNALQVSELMLWD